MFSDIVGHEVMKTRLNSLLEKQKVPHLMLFCGPDGIGKRLVALRFSRSWIEPNSRVKSLDHPDLHVYTTEGRTGMHSISSMRQLIEQVSLKPYQSERKVFIIDEADRMLPSSSNALLKTLEEPPLDTLIILVTSQLHRILPTIVSRSALCRFHCPSCSEIESLLISQKGVAAKEAKARALKARGSIAKALKMEELDDEMIRVKLVDFLLKLSEKTFAEIAAFCEQSATALDQVRKDLEASFTKDSKSAMIDLNAQQRQVLEKEIEGISTIHWMQEVDRFLMEILMYFRDLALIQAGGSPELLWHKDYHQQLLQAVQSEQLIPLEKVEKAIAFVKQGVERSTPLSGLLESAFLRINAVKAY